MLFSIIAVSSGVGAAGPFGVLNPDRYPQGSEIWQHLSDALTQKAEALSASLPLPPRISYHRVRMDDGTGLDTVLINPHPYDDKKGALLARSPYGPTSENIADLFIASNGFAAVLQDDRGTFASGGTFNMWKTAAQDANTTMHWIASQSWSNGEVYTAGVSADGINEAMQVVAAPPQLKGQWYAWTTTNGHHFVYEGGAYRQDIFDGYMNYMNIELHGQGTRLIKEVRSNEAFGDYWRPLTGCPATGDDTHPDAPDCIFKNIKWPIMLNTGWWDIFQHESIDAWRAMRTASDPIVRDKHVHIISPLGHCLLDVDSLHPVMAAAEVDSLAVGAKVAAEMFRGDFSGPTRSKLGRLNMFVMGGYGAEIITGKWNYWTSLDDWPATSATLYFLQPNEKLAIAATISGNASYSYDPDKPAPMLGGNNLPISGFTKIVKCGWADQSTREKRDDVLTFDSELLAEDTPVVGNIHAKLFVSSSAKDTDFVVTISDLSNGISALVRHGVRRMRWRGTETDQSDPMDPGRVFEAEVNLGHTAYVFPKGHRIRVSVSSAAFPYYSANSNSGEQDLVGGITNVVAQNTIHFSAQQPSQITLPIVDFIDIPKNYMFGSDSVVVL